MLEIFKKLFETEYSRDRRRWVKTFHDEEIEPVTYLDIVKDLFTDHTPKHDEADDDREVTDAPKY